MSPASVFTQNPLSAQQQCQAVLRVGPLNTRSVTPCDVRLSGYEARWPGYQGTAERALQSFQELTDRAALNVQPQRVDIVQMSQRTTIEEMVQQRPSPVTGATLALINQVELQTPLELGRLVKWVVAL